MSQKHQKWISIVGGLVVAVLCYVYFWRLVELSLIGLAAFVFANLIWTKGFNQESWIKTPAWIESIRQRVRSWLE